MKGSFSAFLESFCSAFGVDGFFYFFCGIEIVLFIVCLLILSLSRKTRKKDVKTGFILSSAVNFLFLQGLLSLQEQKNTVFFVLVPLALVLLCYIPIALVKGKFCKPKKKESELIKQLGEQAKKETDGGGNFCIKRENVDVLRTASMEIEPEIAANSRSGEDELDFSHVKNILKRLEYYNLTSVDAKQVSELKSALYQAERYGTDREIKSKINDGLGALLKIMSKYGV